MREKKFRRQTELQPPRTILDSNVKAVYCHTGQTVSQIFSCILSHGAGY